MRSMPEASVLVPVLTGRRRHVRAQFCGHSRQHGDRVALEEFWFLGKVCATLFTLLFAVPVLLEDSAAHSTRLPR